MNYKKTKKQAGRNNPISIPTSIFHDRTFSVLEVIAIYIIDNLNHNFRSTGTILKRNERTIWTCYKRAKKKKPESILICKKKCVKIPASVISDRSLSILECISMHLKDCHQFSFREIGKILNRNERTIWTCYNRAVKKKNA